MIHGQKNIKLFIPFVWI